MEFILFGIILLQFAYLVFKDIYCAKERERLNLLALSKTTTEYKDAIEPTPPKEEEVEEDEIVDIEDVPFDKLMEANL